MEESWNMILGINPKLFGKTTGTMGIKNCPKCKKLMDWDLKGIWICNPCKIAFKKK